MVEKLLRPIGEIPIGHLRSLVEAAKGPDPALDNELMGLTYRRVRAHIGATCDCCAHGQHIEDVWVDSFAEGRPWLTTAREGFDFTARLDRALLLAQRLMPDVWWFVAKGRLSASEPLYGCRFLFGADEELGAGEHEASPCLAVIMALLDALGRLPAAAHGAVATD